MALECDWVLCMKTFTAPALQLHGNNYCSRNCWEKGLLRERWLSTCDELEAECNDKRAFLEASRLQVKASAMKADLERTRMQLEDERSRQMRER